MAANCRFAFGVHLLSVLALSPDENYSSEKLAFTVNTNPVVIRRLLLELKNAGLIETQRGPGGGARLAKPAAHITLDDIHRAVAGEIETFGAHPNPPAQVCIVGREIENVLSDVSRRAALAVQREFAAITLADIVAQMGVCEQESNQVHAETHRSYAVERHQRTGA